MNMKKSKVLCDTPRKGIFCGPDKYLKLQKIVVEEDMFPIMEDDSYFLLLRKGCGRFTINGVQFDVEEGNVCWIQCTQVLTIELFQGEPMEIWVYVFEYQLSSYLMYREASNTQKHPIVLGMPIAKDMNENTREIIRLFEDLEKINKQNNYGMSLVKVSLLGQIVVVFSVECSRMYTEINHEEYPIGWRSANYIASNSMKPIKINDVIENIGNDSVTINRELRMVTGMNFEQLVSRNRIMMATSYFLYENLPFSYIAANSGFKSEITFYRNFKKIMNVTPEEYRESILNSGHGGETYRGMIMDETLVSVINYLYNNVSEQINLNQMAKDLYTSGSIIRSLLHKAFGIGYKDLLSLFRVRYSESLLATTDLPIVDISVMIGFYSARTFSRVFASTNGMSPSEYRSMCQERRREN
ncbi:MAG: helix-turn-helix domain-containing protein [Hespellia sp.]|nr:helix-turn-helix domain-containing protein [Hespellia sp.]